MRIRLRYSLVMISLVTTSLAIAGVVSAFSAQQGMSRLAMRHLAFAADTVVRYAENQWDVLVANGLSEDAEFLEAARLAVFSYARSTTWGRDITVTALDGDARILFTTERLQTPDRAKDTIFQSIARAGVSGWHRVDIDGEETVAYLSAVPAFGWQLVTASPAAVFFSDLRDLWWRIAVVIVVTVIVAAFIAAMLSRQLTEPILELANGLDAVAEEQDFDRTVTVTDTDEVGRAARGFNTMVAMLDQSYTRLQEIALGEAEARFEVHERELEALIALGRAAEYKDQETGIHVVRVGMYGALLAHLLGIPPRQRRILYQAAPLHDVGKIAIPDAILLKQGPLSEQERAIMQTHTTLGHMILENSHSAALRSGAEIALTHHERYDGSGYPAGLVGRRIPLFSRILALADVFDALTSERPYKTAWPLSRAFELVEQQRARHFDPIIADLFLEHRAEVEEIYRNADPRNPPVPI